MERAVFEAEHEAALRNSSLFHHLGHFSMADDLSAGRSDEQESMRQALREKDGDGC